MYAPGTKKLTPVMRQYAEAKSAYPDAILFFRLGDFYEMFNEDAVVVARELDLTLTSRNKGAEHPVPMAGVPHHAAHNYLARLIARGHKVAICDQMGDPSKIKGIVPRKVVRVVTPGLLTDTDQLTPRRNNYLCAIDDNEVGGPIGVAFLDLSTAELSVCLVDTPAAALAELTRADPREILRSDSLLALDETLTLALPSAARRSDPPLADEEIAALLDNQVERPLYQDACAQHHRLAVRAAARVLRFAQHHLPEQTLPVRRIAHHDPHATMRLDEPAQRHLELVQGTEGNKRGSLLAQIDLTVTAGGGRLLRRRLLTPLMDVPAIRRRHDVVELFVTHSRAREELREVLSRVGDLERLAVRASLHEITPRQLGRLRDSLHAVPDAHVILQNIPGAPPDALTLDVDMLSELRQHLSLALIDQPPAQRRETGIIREGFDEALDEQRKLKHDGRALLDELEARLRAETQIGSLKIKYTRAYGWYIEVTRTHLDKVPETWRRKQTLTTAERYISDEVDALAEQLTGAVERYQAREQALYDELLDRVASDAESLRELGHAASGWDVGAALAEVAHANDLARPLVDDSHTLQLSEARHPVVEHFVGAGAFVPNDTHLDTESERLMIITGPNMAGKSTLMRQVALCTILAQMGSFVPARAAKIGLVDRILSRVGASDNLTAGESTFMVEMRETATILRDATPRSLVIVDEIGRGTSTFDGLALAWAVAEHLHDAVACRTMFATHYHQLTDLAELKDGIVNYCVSAREHDGSIVFLHRLTAGSVSKSYGIAVARLAGLPESTLGRAGAILRSLETGEEVTGGPKLDHRGSDDGQLALFAPGGAKTAAATSEQTVCETLRHTDPNRLTPLESLELVAKLKSLLATDEESN